MRWMPTPRRRFSHPDPSAAAHADAAGERPLPRRASAAGRGYVRSLPGALAVAALLAGSQGVQARPETQVTAADAWFRYIVPEVPAGGYLTLLNRGTAPAVLVGAASQGCSMLMMHRTVGGAMISETHVTVPGNGKFRFSPGGDHLMCMNPTMQPGGRVAVTLTFADGSILITFFGVRGGEARSHGWH
jgi:copper(I)-binding protein